MYVPFGSGWMRRILPRRSLVLAEVSRASWNVPAAVDRYMTFVPSSTAFAYLIFFRLLAETGATNTSLVTLIIPVSAILLGACVTINIYFPAAAAERVADREQRG